MKHSNNHVDWASKLSKDQIFTIPNLLSFLRIALIPIIAWLYCTEHPYWALAVIVLSGITDVIDGYIARKYNMVTDFGKAIDPIADKLTQGVLLICLLARFPWMWLPLGIMIVKEGVSFALRMFLFSRTEIVSGAVWHGKLCTILLYAIIVLHILWYNVPFPFSLTFTILVSALMVYSFIQYTIEAVQIMKNASSEKEKTDKETKEE